MFKSMHARACIYSRVSPTDSAATTAPDPDFKPTRAQLNRIELAISLFFFCGPPAWIPAREGALRPAGGGKAEAVGAGTRLPWLPGDVKSAASPPAPPSLHWLPCGASVCATPSGSRRRGGRGGGWRGQEPQPRRVSGGGCRLVGRDPPRRCKGDGWACGRPPLTRGRLGFCKHACRVPDVT